jgi:hypothetical protein
MAQARGKAERSDTVQRLARLGLAGRGVLYALVGLLAIRVAHGDHAPDAKSVDRQGVLRDIADKPGGRWLLIAIAVGFAGYAIWRFVEAVLDPDQHGVGHRLMSFARGCLYAGFCWSAAAFVVHPNRSGSSNKTNHDVSATVMRWPMGTWLIAAGGIAVFGAGLWNGYRAVTRKYEKSLKLGEMSARTRRIVTAVAITGLLARMAAFCLVGAFVFRAAINFDPHEAVGIDGALRKLGQAAHGPMLITIVGVGLMAFGAFSLVEARYRKVLDS